MTCRKTKRAASRPKAASTNTPATPMRKWNCASSRSWFRSSFMLDRLLALHAPLRQGEQQAHHRPEHRAGERTNIDRPAGEGVAGDDAYYDHQRLGYRQHDGDMARLQHGTEPEDPP